MSMDGVASQTKSPRGWKIRERGRRKRAGFIINYSTYLENIFPSSSLMKLEISVLSFKHSPSGCLFAASKHFTDAGNNFINWKFRFCKSSGPIWLIWNWMGCLVIMCTYDPASIPNNSSHLWRLSQKECHQRVSDRVKDKKEIAFC